MNAGDTSGVVPLRRRPMRLLTETAAADWTGLHRELVWTLTVIGTGAAPSDLRSTWLSLESGMLGVREIESLDDRWRR